MLMPPICLTVIIGQNDRFYLLGVFGLNFVSLFGRSFFMLHILVLAVLVCRFAKYGLLKAEYICLGIVIEGDQLRSDKFHVLLWYQ